MGLYRGFTSLLIGTVPKTAVRFTAFGAIKQALKVSLTLGTSQLRSGRRHACAG